MGSIGTWRRVLTRAPQTSKVSRHFTSPPSRLGAAQDAVRSTLSGPGLEVLSGLRARSPLPRRSRSPPFDGRWACFLIATRPAPTALKPSSPPLILWQCWDHEDRERHCGGDTRAAAGHAG